MYTIIYIIIASIINYTKLYFVRRKIKKNDPKISNEDLVNESSKKHSTFGNVLLIFLIVGIIAINMIPSDENIDNSKNFNSDVNPCLIAEDFIKDDLNNPATISISVFDCQKTIINNKEFRILQKISAENSFGVEKEYIYELKLRYLGGIEVEKHNWELISMRSEEYR